jgi:phytoene dehydrogenase-like protein
MSERHVVIVGGGLAGLSAGCYLRASGFRTTIVEHNLALGGVCTAWPRGPYVVDGCIHWLTGGAYARFYEELGILPAVPLRTIEHWVTVRDARDGGEITFTRDLAVLARDLCAIAPEDREEIGRLIAGAEEFAGMAPPVDAAEVTPLRDQLRQFWEMRSALGALIHFRKPMGVWAHDHLRSARLRSVLGCVFPVDAPALFAVFALGYLQRGWLSRPIGGTARFRDALIGTYERLGGASRLHSTVDEIVVEDDYACGVRLGDGEIVEADVVVSTSSMPETVLRLLGGRYGADAVRQRMTSWKMTPPIVLASYGVDVPLAGVPAMLMVEGITPFDVGGRACEQLHLRVCNDDPSLAPAGHAVVQALLPTDYTWWATRGTRYGLEKEIALDSIRAQIERVIPDIVGHVRMTDLATPLTYWSTARSWRGAYEGWMPNAESMFGHVPKTLPGLEGFVMAGQWVEPGGGVPTVVLSGRQAAQIVCAKEGRKLVANPGRGRS